MIVLLEMLTWVIFCSLKTSCTVQSGVYWWLSFTCKVTMKTFAIYYNSGSAGIEYKDI